MATLSKYTFSELAQVALLPVAADAGATALVTAAQFGPFVPGDSLVVSSTASFHILAGLVGATVTTANARFGAGTYKFSLPDGCTHVIMIDSSAGAGVGQAYKG